MSANKDEVLAQQDDCIKRCVDRIAEMEAENARLRERRNGWKEAAKAMYDRDEALLVKRAERAEAACAGMREALKTLKHASEFHAQPGLDDHAMRYAHECNVRLCDRALSTTCGEWYARIAEAAEKAKAYADKWGGDVNLALVNKIFEALAAKEPGEEEKP